MEISEKDYENLKKQSESFATFKKNLTDRGFKDVESLIDERDTIAVNLDNVKGHLEKSGKVIERQGAELGRFRQSVVPPKDGEQVPNTPPKNDESGDPPKKEEIVDIEKKMSPEHWTLVEAFYAGLSDDDAKELSEDEEARKKLYKDVMQKKYVRPKTLRDTVKQGNNPPAEPAKFENMFGKFLERGTHVPIGPGSRVPSTPGLPDDQQVDEDARTH